MNSFFIKGTLQFTPWNSFIYNMKTENLELHGIHPRFLHIAVNVPLLFSPISLPLLIIGLIASNKPKTPDVHQFLPSWVIRLSFISISFGLLIISMAPHQEPRFLIPLFFPTILIISPFIFGKNSQSTMKVIHIMNDHDHLNFFFFIDDLEIMEYDSPPLFWLFASEWSH